MPRKKEPSFRVKTIIWDKAATIGKRPEVILRELEHELRRLSKKEDFYEEAPDVRTIKRIIETDINQLSPEVVIVKLQRHVWHLRDDYENIKTLAGTTTAETPISNKLSIALQIIASNLEKIHNAPSAAMGDPFGDTVYTIEDYIYEGQWVGNDRTKLGDVNTEASMELLNHLKKEKEAFPELANIKEWSDLNYDHITVNFIQRLIARAHKGHFQ